MTSTSTEQNTHSIPFFASPKNLGLKDESISIFNDVFEYLSKQDSLSAQILTGHKKQPSFFKKYKLGDLEDELLSKKSKNYKEFQQYLIIINKIIGLGNDLGFWNLCSIIIALKIKSDKNPFGFDFAIRKNTLDQFNTSAGKVFVSPRSNKITSHQLSVPEKIGQLLFYASTRGGLLNTRSLLALIKNLPHPLISYLDRITYPIKFYDRFENIEQIKRWEPDKISTVLIASLITNSFDEYKEITDGITKQNIFSFINKFIKKALGLDLDYQKKKKKKKKKNTIKILYPNNMTDYFEIISTEFDLRVEPYLTYFAKRKFISHAFDDNVYYRKLDTELEKMIAIDDTDDEDSIDDDFYSEIDVANMLFQDTFINKVRDAITNNKEETLEAIKKITGQVEKDIDNKDTKHKPINLFLLQWLFNYIKNGSHMKNKTELIKIYNSFSSFAERLIVSFDDYSPLEMNEEEFDGVYSEILELSGQVGNRKSIANIIFDFHKFLENEYNVVKICSDNVFGMMNRLTPVDSNLVTFEEFNKLIKWIDNNNELRLSHPKKISATKLIVTLAFRCGLRRSEILKLRLCDIFGTENPILYVRPHLFRRLKSSSSQRLIPLKWFLDADEINQILAWKKDRDSSEEENKFSEFLFAILEKNILYLTENMIMHVIHTGLREVTGYKSSRFHHLRHSFISFNLLRLHLFSHKIQADTIFKHHKETCLWFNQAQEHINKINVDEISHLYFICILAGHSTPAITLEYYVHFADLMLRLSIDDCFMPIEKSTVLKATEFSKSTYERLL